MRCFELNSYEVNIISLVIGRKYLYDIVDHYVENEETRRSYYEQVNRLIMSIGNKDTIYNLVIPETLKELLKDTKKKEEVAYRLRGHEEEFQYSYLLYHLEQVLNKFNEDIEQRKIHLWFKLEPKEPSSYLSLDDEVPNYSSFICKFYLRKYKEYTDRNRNSAEGWTYSLCMLYILIISKLYHILGKNIQEFDDFLINCFIALNPIITGFTFTLNYDLTTIPAISVLHELFQLNSSGTHLTISKEVQTPSIEFTYTSNTTTFQNLLEYNYEPISREDNKGTRLVKVLFTGKENTLSTRIDVVGLNAIDDITGLAVKKDFFDLITNEQMLTGIGYQVIGDILSHTQQFEHLKDNIEDYLDEKYPFSLKNNKCRNIFGKDIRNSIRNNEVIVNAFTEIESDLFPAITKALLKKHNINKLQMDYVIIANELATLTDIEVSKVIRDLGNTQKSTIRRRVNFIREFNDLKNLHLLNRIFQKVNYRF